MPDGEIELRAGTGEDAPLVVQVYFAGSNRRNDVVRVANFLDTLPSSLAFDAGHLIGFCFCKSFAPDILELANLFVAASHRGRGVGSQLVMHLESQITSPWRAITSPWRAIILTNSMLVEGVPNKRPAVRFYERLGYRSVWSTGPTEVLMKSVQV